MKSLYNKWQSQKENDKYLESLTRKVERTKSTDHRNAQAIHDEVFEEMDCLQCANCCKSIPPILSNRDIKRISKKLGLSKSDFIKRYITMDEDGDTVMNASPCPFLESDNKCAIYEDRPSACRLYPHSGDFLFFHNLKHHKRNMKYCPGLLEIMKRLSKVS